MKINDVSDYGSMVHIQLSSVLSLPITHHEVASGNRHA
jgi:hypothetical protein